MHCINAKYILIIVNKCEMEVKTVWGLNKIVKKVGTNIEYLALK